MFTHAKTPRCGGAEDLLVQDSGNLVNLLAAVRLDRAFLPGMIERKSGVVIHISSVAHRLPFSNSTLAYAAAKHRPKPGFWYDLAMSAIRAVGYGLGVAYLYGARFGISFGILSTIGQVFAYRIGVRPTIDYQPVARPRLTKAIALSAITRTIGYLVAGYLSALAAGQRTNSLSIALRVGLTIGLIVAVLSAFTSFIEWESDHVPQKAMGVFGVGLILIGFLLQSFQYWAALFDWTAP